MSQLDKLLSTKLAARESKLQMRDRLPIESTQSSEIEIRGKRFVNFSSNDYLGLASRQETVDAVKNQLDESGFGSGASHLITGHHKIHDELEVELSHFLQRDSAITFSTGYMANLSILQSLAQKGDLIIKINV